jgi:hypothetical protein
MKPENVSDRARVNVAGIRAILTRPLTAHSRRISSTPWNSSDPGPRFVKAGARALTPSWKECSMVRFQRAAKAKFGCLNELMSHVRDISNQVTGLSNVKQTQIFLERYSGFGVVHLVVDFPDIATMDHTLSYLAADKGYRGVADKAAKCIEDGGIKDTVLIAV